MTRWTRRLLVGAIAILVPALAGCEAGLNAPTLEYHPAAFGGYATHNGVMMNPSSIGSIFACGINRPASPSAAFFASP